MISRPLARGLSEQVAETLGIRIIQGGLSEGAKIDNEHTLGEEFGVSRTVVRDAMKHLGAKGLVEIRPRLGSKVLPRTRWSNLDPDVLHWHREADPVPEVLLQLREMRFIVEPPAAALAAARCDEEGVAKIMEAYGRMEATVADPESFATSDAEFHCCILRAAKNNYLDALEVLIFTDLISSIKVTNPDARRNTASLEVHLNVAKAIAKGNNTGAQKAMRILLEDAAERLKKAFEKKRRAG